jgi:hypothetical protein
VSTTATTVPGAGATIGLPKPNQLALFAGSPACMLPFASTGTKS